MAVVRLTLQDSRFTDLIKRIPSRHSQLMRTPAQSIANHTTSLLTGRARELYPLDKALGREQTNHVAGGYITTPRRGNDTT
jgi:hypothetical protein